MKLSALTALAMVLTALMLASCSRESSGANAGATDSVVVAGYVHKVHSKVVHGKSADSTGLTVMYTIASRFGVTNSSDVMFDGVRSSEEFTIRLRDIALRMYNDVWLDIDAVRYPCIGSLMPYDIGLANRRTVYLTFNIPHSAIRNAHEAVLAIKDRHFGGGLLSFALDPRSMVNSIASSE